ncbi:MAG: hypothetical protein FWG52_04005 [Proteobacteria bacterium]|nr:hypothetical protein [Pseudomonadota bacterium]
MAPDWLRREVMRGLQALIALRIPGAPAADAVALAADVWMAVIEKRMGGADETSGTQRVRRAFLALCERSRKWPTPAEFFDALPDASHFAAKRISAPALTEEEREANRKRVRKMINDFFNSHRMPGKPRNTEPGRDDGCLQGGMSCMKR